MAPNCVYLVLGHSWGPVSLQAVGTHCLVPNAHKTWVQSDLASEHPTQTCILVPVTYEPQLTPVDPISRYLSSLISSLEGLKLLL